MALFFEVCISILCTCQSELEYAKNRGKIGNAQFVCILFEALSNKTVV